MAGEGAAAGRRGCHRGLRSLTDKGLFDPDIAGPREGLDMGAEIAVGAPVSFSAGQTPVRGGWQRVQRRRPHFQPQRLVDDVVELGHRSVPPHPEAAQNEPAAVDERHPQRERRANE